MINASPSNPRSLYSGPRRYPMIAVFIVVAALLALPLFIGSASSTTPMDRSLITHKVDKLILPAQENVVRNFNFLLPQAGPTS